MKISRLQFFRKKYKSKGKITQKKLKTKNPVAPTPKKPKPIFSISYLPLSFHDPPSPAAVKTSPSVLLSLPKSPIPLSLSDFKSSTNLSDWNSWRQGPQENYSETFCWEEQHAQLQLGLELPGILPLLPQNLPRFQRSLIFPRGYVFSHCPCFCFM